MFKKTEDRKRLNIMRYKSVPVEIKALNEETLTVSGYLASFNTVDDVKDRLIKGCAAKSIREHGPGSSSNRKIAFCYQHRLDQPIGRFTILKEDNKGIYFEAVLDDIPLVRDIVIPQYKSGTLNQHSIGYRYIKAEWVIDAEYGEVYEVYEIELIEGSVVTSGCNEHTPFLGFKSLSFKDVAELHKSLKNLIQGLKKENQLQIIQLFDSLINPEDTYSKEEPSKGEEPKTDNRKSVNNLFKHLKNG